MARARVLVLGTTGMLGWVVHRHLKSFNDLEVMGTTRGISNPSENLLHFNGSSDDLSKLNLGSQDWLINCVGVIKPHCKENDPVGVRNAIEINSRLPWRLAEATKGLNCRIIQIATDCVFSGEKGTYDEGSPHDPRDVYGKSKSLGEVFGHPKFLNVRCSIIGPELKSHLSLLDWFLTQPQGSELKGFTHHSWNGVTTLQFANLCRELITKDHVYDRLMKESGCHHFVPNEIVSKFELLRLFNEIYERGYKIVPVDNFGPQVDRTLSTKFCILNEFFGKTRLETALRQLKVFTDRERPS